MGRTLDEILKIISAGAEVTISAKEYSVEHLVRVAAAAKKHEIKVHITGTNLEPIQNLLRIAEAGNGFVSFEM